MTTFDDRERGFENKYAHDKELEFKIAAKTNKLFGLWAAKLLELPAAEADDYAKQIVQSNLNSLEHWDVLEKVMYDLRRKNIAISKDELSHNYANFRHEAEKLLKTA